MRPSGSQLGILGTVLVLAAAAAASATGPATGSPPSARHVAPLAWLVGGVWTADCSKLGGGMRRIETRYQWADNDAYVRFTTHFVSDKGTLKNYDGNFFWSPDPAGLRVWYMDHENEITQGDVTIDGDAMRIAFRAPDFEGKLADLHADVVRASNDFYRWTLSEKNGEEWKPLLSLEYRRTAGS